MLSCFQAFRSPVMFARKFDPSLYPDALAALGLRLAWGVGVRGRS